MSMRKLQVQGGVFENATLTALNANLNELFGRVLGAGNVFFCDYLNGSDTVGDGSISKPFKTIANAYGSCVSGHNDVVAIIGDGATTGTQRVSAALAWGKNATHLIGICSPTMYSQRARIAPTTTGTAYTPLVSITGNGCVFANVAFYHGFATGTTSQICVAMTGDQNVFRNVHFAGMADAESAANAGSRIIKFTGSSENLFEDCVIGVDTVSRSAANASIEFASASKNNVFRKCLFPFMCSAATPLAYIGAAAACMDRSNQFHDCAFVNAVGSGTTTMTALGTMAASSGGFLLFKNTTLVGITDYGSDATSLGICRVDGGAPTAATSGIAVTPT